MLTSFLEYKILNLSFFYKYNENFKHAKQRKQSNQKKIERKKMKRTQAGNDNFTTFEMKKFLINYFFFCFCNRFFLLSLPLSHTHSLSLYLSLSLSIFLLTPFAPKTVHLYKEKLKVLH